MPGPVRSRKQAQIQHASALRADGLTWGEVAAAFRDEYRVNARVALRLAHGWSQSEVADRWNQRWPEDLKTFKNISYWEKWPAATGYAPSLEVLTRLAAIYSCQVTDLLVDVADHRAEDPVFRARSRIADLPSRLRRIDDTSHSGGDDGSQGSDELNAIVAHLQSVDVRDLAGDIALWSTQLDPGLDHRSLLVKLGFALTLAAASPADPDSLAAARRRTPPATVISPGYGAASTPTTAVAAANISPGSTTSHCAGRDPRSQSRGSRTPAGRSWA
jgi:hypothetical protein